MIDKLEILEILEKSQFPVIDFKLQNRGKGKALLRRFHIHVDSIDLDVRPLIKCSASFVSARGSNLSTSFEGGSLRGSLGIALQNDGWGPANNLEVSLRDPLKELFPSMPSRQLAQVDSGESEESVLILSPSDIDKSVLNRYIVLSLVVAKNMDSCEVLPHLKDRFRWNV